MESCSGASCPACSLSRVIRRAATTKALLASLVLWLAALTLINGKPLGIAQLQEITGGPTILDMTFLTTAPTGLCGSFGPRGYQGGHSI